MGAAAFIMAELLGIPYLSVCLAATLPAILYFSSVFAQVRFEAVKLNLRAIPQDEIPKLNEIIKWNMLAPLFIPVGVLIIFLFRGYDPYRACFYAFVVAIALYMFTDFSLQGWVQRFNNIIGALEKGVAALVGIIPVLVCAQIFVSLLSLSGLGSKFSALIISLSGQKLFLGLVFTAMISLILGMSLPTTAAYLLATSVAASALVSIGIDPLSAHLFIFYFAIISALTPPVCIAAFTAAAIAQTDWIKIAWVAVRLSIVSYIMPFLFIYNPVFLLRGEIFDIILAVLTAFMGVLFLSSGIIGYFSTRIPIIVRLSFISGGIFLFLPSLNTTLIALPLIGAGLVITKFSRIS